MSLAAPALIPTSDLHAAVFDWYDSNARDLAFRRTSDPWAILVSEVMAQQTQAERAAEAWTRFMATYPTPAALAAASPADVIRAWRGLGYNRRAIALRSAAIAIVADHDGRVPDDLDALERLPGIGPYTARAVAALAFGRPVAALDTNIRRVLGRVLRLEPRARTVAAERAFQSTADGLVPPDAPGRWTHALMDIGATFCRPRDPRCDACPIAARCASARSMSTSVLAEGIANVGRSTPPKPTQPFRSTTRWLRGRILDALRDAPAGAWVDFTKPMGEHQLATVNLQLERLAAERLLERHPDHPSRARLAAA